MHTLVMSALLFHSLAAVAIMLGAAVVACQPQRRALRPWAFAPAAAMTMPSQPAEAELLRAA